ncbi:hypothetical protein NUN68_004344 [Salmonella enterica subsp. enterica serovar Newport]|nr:hypothetical protein [Salmonella enterica subsp. enterica serovar Newport]EJO8772568.1 hypothetical protein [Salmonella enterica subsp. enterica serovar Newport]
MDRNRQVNKVVHFLLTLLIMFAVSIAPAQALLKGGTWQELNSVTGAVNGTAPLADGAIIPLYQGSTLLDPSKTHDIEFSAMPRDFSADATSTSMRAVNSTDTEGDLFSDPPTIAWENRQPPAMGLVWADAATPDTPLSPQPVPNLTFCAQNLAGRQLVAWAQVEDETNIPALWLFTNTGVPNYATIPLLSPKVTLNIKPAVSDPVSVSGDHVDASFEASKVKVGESITLTVTTKACDGEPAINAPFVIRREDAINRQGVVNNANPVRVGNTELTTAQTEYHGVTDGQGNATVVVTQENGPGVKTRLIVSSQNYPTLTDNVDVIFTTITSPDSDKASMYGHMVESTTATLNGITYTFTRPKLAAEASGADKSVVDTNETWALFDWNGADNHCNILPDAEQLVQMRHEHSTLATYTGWPATDDAEYWSSTKDQMSGYHAAVHMNSASVVRAADSDTLLVSCVDKAQPAAHPQITLSPQGPYKAQVGESIDLTMTVVDRDTQKPLPYRYMELFIDPAKNRKGEHQDAWDNLRVTVDSEGMSASSPEHYTGVTDVNGQAHLTLKHNSGLGVETPIRIVMPDDEGGNVELSFSVIFTVVTSPDVDGANMWGHMRGVVDAGNLYKRPLLAVEASHKDGQFSENNEEWATFNSVASATAQCGVGQVPDQSSLAHLYSEHTGGQMESEHGWPTEDYFIAADSDASGTVHVNLENGDSGKFTDTPNYLTCSANEMVAVLDVYFNDDPVIKNADAKVGEQVKMNIHSRNALNGIAIGNTDFTITMANGRRRDGLTTGFTDTSNGEMQFDDVGYVAGQVYHGITDANGDATIILTQKKGVGLLTPLSIVPVNSYINTPVSRSVKFTVATSPDTAKAKMWGHMADTITVGDWTFERPKLAGEVSNPLRTQDESNETWARVAHSDAVGNPDAGGCAANRLPRIDQLEALYNANSGGKIHSIQGWPTYLNYWSSTYQSATTWKLIALTNGSEFANSNVSIYASCLASDNPVAASITIEPVNPSQWYDGSDVHAVKVKKGETMQLKVTVKDASGNPIPEAPFVLTRGDGYDRRGEKYTAQDGDDLQGIVTPVVIDGESLAWTTTKMGSQTGTDGTRIISVTRPDAHGTKVAITAALYNNASATASIDTIFTVVTSPDSDKAKMWGHMPETTTAANGEVFKRPLLSAEIASGVTHGDNTENNEAWGIVDFEMANDACGAGYVPTLADMQSLYDARPGGAMNTQQGWPLDGKNYQDSTADLSRSTQNRYVKSINLRDGGVGSLLWNEQLYFVCLQNAHPAATQITLTSPVYNDSDGFAKAKVGETIPVIITTRDAQGNPAADTPVIFTRGDSVGRANQEVNSSAADIQINHSDGRSSGANYYTATGADGTLTLNISQDSGAGFKTPLTAAIEHNGVTSAPLPVIFTVVTSPDTPKANYWGHMAETLTDSSGVAYRRPLLASEFSATPGKTLTIANGYYDKGETWGMITVDKAWNGTGGGCGRDTLPTVANLQTLYGTYPDNAMRSRNGWPMTSSGNNNVSRYWWAGDYVISSDGTKSLYAAVNLFNDGNDVKTTTSTSMYYMQTCLASPRSAAASLTLTLAGQDETTGSAKAKKGEQMAATIDVKDAAGQPMKNVMVKISRGSSYNRANSATSSSSVTDDITLRNVMPSGLATYLLDTSAKYLYAQTDAQGQVTFTLAQDSTAGLKTTISAATMDGSNLTDSKDAIFTVVTSPDSDKAKYWGHMPETFTNSKGVEFKRPLLRAELSSTADTSGYTENNETWYTWSRYPNMYQDTASPCDRLGLPTVNDLQTLYTDYPNGALTTTLGLPVASGKYWGAGNSVPDATHSDSQFQYVRLSDNNTLTTKANTATAQLCLAKRRELSIELTSSAMDADKGAPVAKKGESLPLTVTVRDGSGTPQPNTAIRLGRTLSIDRSGVVDGSSGGGGMILTSVAPSTGSMTFNCTASSCTSYWYGMTDENGKAQLEVTQDDSRGLRTPLQAMLVDDPLTVSDMDVIFTVITSPDSDKAKYWGHMPETVTNSAGVKFRRPLLAAEMTSNSGTYLVNNETWPLVTAANTEKAGATGCDAEYQPLSGDLQTLYSDNPNGAIGTNYGWPVAGNKSWWAADRAPNTGYYQFINLNSGGKGTASSSTATGAQVCLVEPRTSTPASITLTSTAMDSAKNAAVVAKGSAMPLTVTVKDSSGNPVANVGFTLSRGDSKNRAGMVITDGDVAADAGADDLMLKELTPASASQSMTTTGIVFTGTTGSDGTATFTLNQDKSLGLKTPLTVKVTDNTTLHASLDVIFMVLTSPDTDKALFWGNMSDTTSVNGKTLHRPWLQAEMLSGVTPVFTNGVHANNEYWAMAHTVDNTKWDIAKQCGSLSKAPDNNDLLTLYHSISSLGWPTQGYPYLSKSTSSGGMYCGVDENTRQQNCAIKPANTAGYATCVE